ncbi:MAG TPA: HD domain-containing protein [Terriglobales bacterium]|jgi:(p)ppGpp synthase/HD superfamily hydrolase|nr:HD domain-containing protein [Terriglobales bacterium]
MTKRSATRAGSKPRLGRRFEQALLFAFRKHNGQKRKGTEVPYIAHLLGVASLVLEAGGDEDLAIAALLHDVVEDCGGAPMLKEVRRRFGRRVAHVVAGCTDADTYPKPPWRARKENYLRHLRTANADVRLVSVADKVHNARAVLNDYREIGEPIWERFQGRRDGTLWYYRELAKEFRRRNPSRLGRELRRVVGELETVASRERARRKRK